LREIEELILGRKIAFLGGIRIFQEGCCVGFMGCCGVESSVKLPEVLPFLYAYGHLLWLL
jgi:hypothetical protein